MDNNKKDKGFQPNTTEKRTLGSSGYKPKHSYPTASRVSLRPVTSHPALNLPVTTTGQAKTALDKIAGQRNTLEVMTAQYDLVGAYWNAASSSKRADISQLGFNTTLVDHGIATQKLAAKEYDFEAAKFGVELSQIKAGSIGDSVKVASAERQLKQAESVVKIQSMELKLGESSYNLETQRNSLERLHSLKQSLKPITFNPTVEVKGIRYES
jgi:hypothetical protein